MSGTTISLILCVGVPLLILNELVVWKLWSRCTNKDNGLRKRTAISTILLDPLVSSIVCPLAADLYSSLYWLGCEAFLVFTISTVMIVLYVSTLIICYRLLLFMSPRWTSVDIVAGTMNPLSLSFCLSVVINVVLTWSLFALLQPGQADAIMYDSESCQDSIRQNSVIFIFIMGMVIQLVHVLFYAFLSHKVVSQYQDVLYHQEKQCDYLEDSDRKSIVLYTITVMVCLALANLLRLSFTHCSCFHFITLARGLYFTNWVIAVKLPASGLIYFLFYKVGKKI